MLSLALRSKLSLKLSVKLFCFLLFLFGLPLLLGSCSPVQAQIGHLPENIRKILDSAWPAAEYAIAPQTHYLTEEQHSRLQKAFHKKYLSRIYTLYTIRERSGSRIKGYAMFDTHVVRSKSETLLFAIDPDGLIEDIEVVAFHEPKEYRPPGSWLKQFQKGALAADSLALSQRVDALSGATLTRRAVMEAAAKILFLYQIQLQAP